FLWFWASLVVLVLVSYGLSLLSGREPENVVRRWGDPFALHSDYARDALRREGRAGLLAFLGRVETRSRMRAYVIDRHGHELRGRPLTPGLDALARDVLAGHATGLREEIGGRRCFAYLL